MKEVYHWGRARGHCFLFCLSTSLFFSLRLLLSFVCVCVQGGHIIFNHIPWKLTLSLKLTIKPTSFGDPPVSAPALELGL